MNIGEAARAAGVSAKMIHYYASIGLLLVVERTKGVHTLRSIKRSRDPGFSIERIRALLGLWEDRIRKRADVKQLAPQYSAELNEGLRKFQSIRSQLQLMRECGHGDSRPDCPIIEQLSHSEQEMECQMISDTHYDRLKGAQRPASP